MLIEAVNFIKKNNGDIRLMKLYGQEKNLTTSTISRMNLILHGLEDFSILRGDTLRNPLFINKGGELMTYDCVIANPPFSLKNWGYDIWNDDKYRRKFAGLPPKTNSDFAWVQHMISSIKKPNGRMAVVLPQGILFRVSTEGKIRKHFIQSDYIDAIIGLGSNLFYGTGLAPCILKKIINNIEQIRSRS